MDRTLCELAQPRCDDVVLGAAIFAPNAPGRRELSCLRGLVQRQFLKGQAAYLADRVLVAITTVEVVAMAVGLLSRHFRTPIRWRRDHVVIRPVSSRRSADDAVASAFVITGITAGPSLELASLELAGLVPDRNTSAVTARLIAIGRQDTMRS